MAISRRTRRIHHPKMRPNETDSAPHKRRRMAAAKAALDAEWDAGWEDDAKWEAECKVDVKSEAEWEAAANSADDAAWDAAWEEDAKWDATDSADSAESAGTSDSAARGDEEAHPAFPAFPAFPALPDAGRVMERVCRHLDLPWMIAPKGASDEEVVALMFDMRLRLSDDPQVRGQCAARLFDGEGHGHIARGAHALAKQQRQRSAAMHAHLPPWPLPRGP